MRTREVSRPMPEDFDVIVVGARCAGSPLATLLARAGLRVCLLDRARFPSDTPSTHGVQPSGVTILERLGVLERLLEVATPIERGTIALDGARIEVDAISERLGAPMLNIRRIALDAVLLEAAGAAGAEVRTGTAARPVGALHPVARTGRHGAGAANRPSQPRRGAPRSRLPGRHRRPPAGTTSAPATSEPHQQLGRGLSLAGPAASARAPPRAA
jgi:hypothetical protein